LVDELPALRNENVWVSGFRNIVFYLRELSEGKWDLDADLEGLEKADCIA
jgi:sorting and assembly machinery component 37